LGDLGSQGSPGPRPPPELVVAIGGPLRPKDIRTLCETLRRALEGGPAVVLVCDISPATPPDLRVVEALARLTLTAKRCGRQVVVRRACPEVSELVDLAGLSVVPGLDLEPRRQAEEREPPGRVEEERDPGDPVA
jgi:STAS domain